ncbi:MAG: tRNA (adenosine(37)-N6)-dimethylallyltransferase MiaA [Candidatus Rokubacteria bacterium]|nr:tRNA (adenosine(37)-N6)-dimethylallyltransferase MiaA [Candidatus Rokubacteria bacterium]
MVGAPPLLVIVGPTGVGKTAVAARLAQSVPMAVVSADSRQVYRGMDAATGKPTSEERQAVRHHLLDLIEPGERYHAARFRLDAAQAIEAIRAASRLPVVVGGTGLYVRALLRGLDPAPAADPAARAQMGEIARTQGPAALYERLRALDPERAARLHPNDKVRVIRAIEKHDRGATSVGGWARATTPWHVLMFGLRQERVALNRRLEERARGMLAGGMMEEVRRLLASGHDETAPGMAGIGYRQWAEVARGRLSPAEALRLMVRDTQRYAKRQMTWFAREPAIQWLDVDEVGGVEGAAECIHKHILREGWIA